MVVRNGLRCPYENRLPKHSIESSPYEKLTGKKPKLKDIRVFGCAAFVYEHGPESNVLEKESPAILLGYNDHGEYTAEKISDRKVVNSVNMTFDETCFPALDYGDSSSSREELSSGSDYESESDSGDDVSCIIQSDVDEDSTIDCTEPERISSL